MAPIQKVMLFNLNRRILSPNRSKIDKKTAVCKPLLIENKFRLVVLLITGGLDTLTPVSYCSDSTLKSVEKWLHWEDATHSFNESIGGAFKRTTDGTCQTMVNGFGSHQFCYSENRVKQMLDEVRVFSYMPAQ